MSEYPSEELLRQIEDYDLVKEPVVNLIDLLRKIWHFREAGYFIEKPSKRVLTGERILELELHTGGWSGNEDIISALKRNKMFFMRYWYKEERGGHYYFMIEGIPPTDESVGILPRRSL